MTSHEDIESEVSKALAEVKRLEAEQTRKQAAAEAAQADYERALDRLREEFGVSTAAEAKALYDSLGEELRAELDKVNAALAEAAPDADSA